MSEDDSRTSPGSEPHERRRGWLERLSSAISGEPSNRDDLVELLRDTHADGLIDADGTIHNEGTQKFLQGYVDRFLALIAVHVKGD